MKIATEVEIPDSLIEEIIDTAGYGIAYWAADALWDKEKRTYRVKVSNPEDLTTEQPASARLTYRQIAQALIDVALGRAAVRGDLLEQAATAIGDGAEGITDSDLADVIIQWAMFKEVVFG